MPAKTLNTDTAPRWALVAAGVLLAASVALALLYGKPQSPAERDLAAGSVPLALKFIDGADGGFTVLDADTTKVVFAAAPGTNHFIRGLMRGLIRERRQANIGSETPFKLYHNGDQRLILEDPATGRIVALEAFGHDNAGVFATMLAAGGRAQ